MMSKQRFVLLAAVMLVLGTMACNRNKGKQTADTFMSGTTGFLVDESFAPIIDQELNVFKSGYPDAKPQVQYKSENEAINLLMTDSITFAILARNLTAQEARVMESHALPALVDTFAADAVALIVSRQSADTTITLSEVKAMLNGTGRTDKNIVFDNPNSSVVRYLKELSGSKALDAKNIYALKSNKEVIKYVSQHPQSIGIVGYSWLDEPDADYAAAAAQVKTMAVKDDKRKDDIGFTKPSQENLALKTYPLSRWIYIINCSGRQGLGTGFAGFLLSDRGQRIVLKSGLLPAVMPGREISINEDIKL